jgi:hypothetical protein
MAPLSKNMEDIRRVITPQPLNSSFPLATMPPSSASRRLSGSTSTTLMTSLKILRDASEALCNMPYLKSVAGVCLQILEIREVNNTCHFHLFTPYHILKHRSLKQIISNKDAAYELIERVAIRSQQLIELLRKIQESDLQGSFLLNTLEEDSKRFERQVTTILDSHSS